MAEKKNGGYYKVAAGFTTAHGVAQEGQIVRAEDMTSGDVEFDAMSPEDQQAHFGRVLYEEYTPEEGDVIVGSEASGPPYPPGDSPIVAEEDLVRDPREEESEAKPARSTRSSAATPAEERRVASEPRPTTEEHRRARE